MEEAIEKVQPEHLDKAQEYIDFVSNNLAPLAEHLEVGVEWVWDILVMQARVEAIIHLAVLIGLFSTTAFMSRLFFKNIKTATFRQGYINNTKYRHIKTGDEINDLVDDWKNRSDYKSVQVINKTNTAGYISMVSGSIMGMMLLMSLVASATSLKIIVTGLVNPEFRAIENIVNFSQPKVQEIKGE